MFSCMYVWCGEINHGRFEINQLLFPDDTALVADSEQKLCRLVTEFGRVCERKVSECRWWKVMRCMRYVNGGPIVCETKW